MVAFAAEVAPGAEGVERDDVAVVAVAGKVEEHVGRDPGAVDAFPGKEIVGEEIRFVPVELDGEETVDPGAAQELRHPAGETEDIRQPGDGVAAAEGGFEVALPVEEVADEGFAAGELQSDSSHMPPIGSQRPSATRSLIRAKRAGSSCSIQA